MRPREPSVIASVAGAMLPLLRVSSAITGGLEERL
jgi:hypothetical protein